MTDDTPPKHHSRYDLKKLFIALLFGLLVGTLLAPHVRSARQHLVTVEETPTTVTANAQRTPAGADEMLANTIMTLGQRISAVEARPESDIHALETRLLALEERIAALETIAAGEGSARLGAEIEQLRREIQVFELRQRLSQGEHYADLLPGLARSAAPEQLPHIASLQELAGSPAITLETLADAFESARASTQAANVPDGLWERIKHQLRQSVRVRRIGEATNEGEPLDRAAMLIQDGRVTEALGAVRGMPAAQARHFDAWSGLAEDYLRQQAALASLAASLAQPIPAAVPQAEPLPEAPLPEQGAAPEFME